MENNQISASRYDHFIFVIVTLFYWISLYIYVPILSPYMESLGATYAFVGIVLGSYGFMQILIRLPIGILSDQMRRRKPYIALGLLTTALSCFCLLVSDHLGWTLASRMIAGISASTWVAFTVLYASYFSNNETTRAMGIMSLVTVIGQLVGMGFSGYLVDIFGWHSTFWIGGIVGIVGFFIAFLIKEPQDGVAREPIKTKDLTSVMKVPIIIKVSLLSILAHSILFITMFGFTPSYAISLDASKSELSYLVFAFMIPHGLAAYYSGKSLAPRFGSWNVILVGFVFSGLCTLLIPFVQTLPMLYVTQAINGLALGLSLPLFLGLAIETIEHSKRATAMGFYQAVYAIGIFMGPFVAGWVNNSIGLTAGFYFGGSLGIIASILTLYWGYKSKKEKQTGVRI